MSLLFSIDNIDNSFQNRKLVYEMKDSASHEDYSIFKESLKMILSEKIKFNSITCSEGISNIIDSESGIVTDEKLEKFNSKDAICEILNWFINSIDKISDYYETYYLSYINDRALYANKGKLHKYDGEVEFSNSIKPDAITYSCTSFLIPELKKVIYELNQYIDKFSYIRTNTQIAEYISKISEIAVNEEIEIDNIRAKLLNSSEPVGENIFAASVYCYFRNTGNFRIILTNDQYKQIFDYYFFNNQKMIIRRDIIKMKTEIEKLKQDIKSYDGDFINNSITKIYNNIVYLKCNKIKNICELILMVFGAKIDACKELNINVKSTLYDVFYNKEV